MNRKKLKMNYRTLVVDSTHDVEPFNNVASYATGCSVPYIVRPREHKHTFDITIYENGTRIMRKLFSAQFNDADVCGDEKILAEKIIYEMKYSKEIYIYASDPPPRLGDEWTNKIVFSDSAKEIFSWLTKYTQRLIESF